MSEPVSVQVWQQPDKMWRWRWVQRDSEGNEEISITSYKAFESCSQAEETAREAYPGVPVHAPKRSQEQRRRHRHRWWLVALAGASAVVVAGRVRRRRKGPT